MKKTRLINSALSSVIAEMGHLDELTVADAGLPIPIDMQRIDLAVAQDIPRMLSVLDAIFSELKVEGVIIAQECKSHSPEFYNKLIDVIEAAENKIVISLVSHSDLKRLTVNSKAIVRTGEFTPFANIILQSGVIF